MWMLSQIPRMRLVRPHCPAGHGSIEALYTPWSNVDPLRSHISHPVVLMDYWFYMLIRHQPTEQSHVDSFIIPTTQEIYQKHSYFELKSSGQLNSVDLFYFETWRSFCIALGIRVVTLGREWEGRFISTQKHSRKLLSLDHSLTDISKWNI